VKRGSTLGADALDEEQLLPEEEAWRQSDAHGEEPKKHATLARIHGKGEERAKGHEQYHVEEAHYQVDEVLPKGRTKKSGCGASLMSILKKKEEETLYRYQQAQVLKPHAREANEDHEEIDVAQEFHMGTNGQNVHMQRGKLKLGARSVGHIRDLRLCSRTICMTRRQ
jgi:hypothetical protein